MKTTRSGRAEMAGRRCVNQSLRFFLTFVRRRSVATSVIFLCKAKPAQEPANSIGMRLKAGRVYLHRPVKHGHVSVLINKFDQQGATRIKLAPAARTDWRPRFSDFG